MAYTTSDEVLTFIGTLNADIYGDLNGDGSLDAGAMTQALATADARATLYGGGVPTFTADAAGTQAAALWNQAAYKLATYELAAKRGFANLNENAFIALKNEAIEDLKAFRADRYGVEVSDEDEDDAGTFQSVPMVFEPAECDENAE